jgi:hypothetical protein
MAEERRAFRFLQISDVHLDARLQFKRLGMGASKRFERNLEALETVARMCDVAAQRGADAVVVAGNLWDGQGVTAATVTRLVDCFTELGAVPVVICPGISDPLVPQSFYHNKVLSAHAIRPWPSNVHIFHSDQPTTWAHPYRKDVRFWGRANLGVPKADETLPPIDANVPTNVFVDCQPFDVESGNRLLSHYSFCCFGATPNYQTYRTPAGHLRGATAGTLIARSLEEPGVRTALLVEIDAQGHVTVERIPSDPRMVVSVAVSINGIKAASVADHVRKAVEAAGPRAGVDMVHIKLSGIHPADQPPDPGHAQLSKNYYHVNFEDSTRPDYFIDKADKKTAAGRFIQVLQELKKLAEARGGTLQGTSYGAELTTRHVEDALYYGLEALNHKKVTVPDVD